MTEDWIRFIFIEWVVLFLCLLPRYYIQKKKNPYNAQNTIMSLVIHSLVVCMLFAFFIQAMYKSCRADTNMYIVFSAFAFVEILNAWFR